MRWFPTLLLLATVGGCGPDDTGSGTGTAPPAEADPYAEYADYDLDHIRFLDVAPSQELPDTGLRDLEFVDRIGVRQKVADFAPGKHIVLVVTRGNTEPICPFCSTQTAEYVRRYDEIARRGAEVILAYPVLLDTQVGRIEVFLDDARQRLEDPNREIPFPVVFDVQLEAVDALGIRAKLAKPATYVVDRRGRVRYAYVGSDWSDRPSVSAVVTELNRLNEEPDPADTAAPHDPRPEEPDPVHEATGERTGEEPPTDESDPEREERPETDADRETTPP